MIRPDARSIHHWRDDWRTYLRQQYGFGYGRLDLVAKHQRRVTGDDVSGWFMMLHAPAMVAVLTLALLALALRLAGMPAAGPVWLAAIVLLVLAAERFVTGLGAALHFRNPAGFWFVPVHLVRDLAWAAAIVVWGLRRLRGLSPRPSDSMQPRTAVRPGREGL